MTSQDIDAYLAAVPEPQRTTLQKVRETILSIIPDAEECIAYQMPAFKLSGKTVAGIAAFKNHCAYLPHSGSVLSDLDADLLKYERTKSSLHFSVDKPLPKALVRKLIAVRRHQAGV